MLKAFFYGCSLICLIAGKAQAQRQAPKPFGPVPSENQLRWQKMEYYAFLHFSINTFTGQEWGSGGDDPKLFNPDSLDCRQWARVCKEAGMKGIILTAKHHSGFCLWPSKYTEYSVKNCPWKGGKGDIVRELADACREYGLKLGVYLSPWDRNYAGYGKPEYITYFRNQLRELLTNYGDIFEIWFDGANGGSGYYGGANETRKIDRRTYYDWKNTYKLIRQLQPKIVIWNDGGDRGDLRWVGTEDGYVGETNWSLLNATGDVPDDMLAHGVENGDAWVPGEVNTSIRPGWFYHEYEDSRVKSLPKLLDIYYSSSGRNGALLLNFPIDRHGRIHANDEKASQELAAAVKQTFATNLAEGAKAAATNVRGRAAAFGAAMATDGKEDTYWATDDSVKAATLSLDFGRPITFNRFLVQEYIRLGQRVKAFSVEAMVDGQWKTLANATTIGYKRILRLPSVTATALRLVINDAKTSPLISNIGVYNAPQVLTAAAPVDSGSVISHRSWRIANSQDPEAVNAIDGDVNSAWHQGAEGGAPADIVIDLGDELTLKGFRYLPDQHRNTGIITNYQFFVSSNLQEWALADEGEFGNIRNNPMWQDKSFARLRGRYIRLRAIRNTTGTAEAGYAELDVITDTLPGARPSVNAGPYQPSTASLKQYQYPEWFRNAKFGIWAHWGPQAVPRRGDWYARRMYLPDDNDYKDHLARYGHPSTHGYKDIIPLWHAEKWDPDKLMALYKKAGAKYFVSMASHHDNFYLWNSAIHSWNAVKMGPHKDVVGIWQQAAQKQGLKFGVSEHLAASYTWFQAAHASDPSGQYKDVPYDGNDPQYAELYHTRAASNDRGWLTNGTEWPGQWYNVVKELVDSYHPDLLYSDSRLPFGDIGRSMLANFYNGNIAFHKGEMTAVYTCKQPSDGQWAEDIERGVQDSISIYPWQTDTSIGDWFYATGQKYKSATDILRMLVDIVSKNGNLLINIVQTPEGDLEKDMLSTLDDIGKWTAVNGEGIYGSRPWKIFGERPADAAVVKTDNFNEDRLRYTAEDVRFTTNGNKLYAFLLDVPASDIHIRSLGKASSLNTRTIRSVSLLGSAEKLRWEVQDAALVIHKPSSMPAWKVLGLKIELSE